MIQMPQSQPYYAALLDGSVPAREGHILSL